MMDLRTGPLVWITIGLLCCAELLNGNPINHNAEPKPIAEAAAVIAKGSLDGTTNKIGKQTRSSEAAAQTPEEMLKSAMMMMQLLKMLDPSAAPAGGDAPAAGSGDAPPAPAEGGSGGGMTMDQLIQLMTLMNKLSAGAGSDDADDRAANMA